MFDNEKNRECKYCWNELMNALNFGNTRCGHCGKTPAEKEVKRTTKNRPLKNGEEKRHREDNDWLKEQGETIIGLRPKVGDYWGSAVKTRKNPHGLGFGDRYCGIHEKPMTEGFRKGVDKGRHIYKCDECYFHELIPPKAKMDWEEVKKVLKPYHY